MKTTTVVKDSLVADIFNYKNTTPEDFNNSLSYYKRNPEEWVSVLQKTRDHIRKLKNLQPGDFEPVE
jgi:hypothetical protein